MIQYQERIYTDGSGGMECLGAHCHRVRYFTSAATDLLVLDDLGDEVARAQVIRNGHPYSQDAYVRKTCEQLQKSNRRRDTDVCKFAFSDDGRRATVAYMGIRSVAFACSVSDAAAHCGPSKNF